MKTFLKYLAVICLTVVMTTVALASMLAYQMFSRLAILAEGADTYTCGQFVNDMSAPDKLTRAYPFVVATLAYGNAVGEETLHKGIQDNGLTPAVSKVLMACEENPDRRVLAALSNDALMLAGIAPVTVVASGTLAVSGTEYVSGTDVVSATSLVSGTVAVSETDPSVVTDKVEPVSLTVQPAKPAAKVVAKAVSSTTTTNKGK